MDCAGRKFSEAKEKREKRAKKKKLLGKFSKDVAGVLGEIFDRKDSQAVW
jgi:hypothetical protein